MMKKVYTLLTYFAIALLAVAGGVIASNYFSANRVWANTNPAIAAPVQPPGQQQATAAVGKQPAVGSVDPLIVDGKVSPVQTADLSFSTSGTVVKLLIKEGEQVAAGQVLIQLDSTETRVLVAQSQANLQKAQAKLDQLRAGPLPEDITVAQATLDSARARLARIQKSTSSGDLQAAQASVTAAQAGLQKVLEGATEQQLIEARANLAGAEAKLRQAQSDYDQVKWRNDISALPQSLALEQATINDEAAKAHLADLKAGPTQAAVSQAQAQVSQASAQYNSLQAARPADIETYSADVRKAEAQLEQVKRGARKEEIAAAEADVAAMTAALQQQLVALGKLELHAPFAGVIASLDVETGERVSMGERVIRLADLNHIQIETTDLTELQVVHIKEGDAAHLAFDALPNVELTGHVVRIRPFGENNFGDVVYRAIIEPEASQTRLLWNMTAEVSFSQ
ncbi:MAG: efflux RND transporter periplasmic adaptor subunit [Caldilineaceae bacterium]